MNFSSQEVIDLKLKHFYESEGAIVSYNDEHKIAICETTGTFIPFAEFKILFRKISELVENQSIKKFIFDKRSLKTFHQPSMEWYYLIWKKDMYSLGLKVHRKILPQDRIFRECVRLGHEKIKREFPDNMTHLLDIQYAESLEEAINI